MYYIRNYTVIITLFLFSFFIAEYPEYFLKYDHLFLYLVLCSFFAVSLVLIIAFTVFRIPFTIEGIIGDNSFYRMIKTIFHLPSYVIFAIDFLLFLYLCLSVLVFGTVAFTVCDRYLKQYITIINVGIVILVIIIIYLLYSIINKYCNNKSKIQVIIEYIYWECRLVSVSAKVREMIRKDKSSVNYKNDERAIKFNDLLNQISELVY